VVEACRALRTHARRTRVLVLIDRVDISSVRATVLAGADGCLARSSRVDDVRRVVRTVATGVPALDPSVTRILLDHLRQHPAPADHDGVPLSSAECRALQLVADGKTNREIAAALAVSEKTVKNWLGHAFGKLHVSRRAEAAVRFALPGAPILGAMAAAGGRSRVAEIRPLVRPTEEAPMKRIVVVLVAALLTLVAGCASSKRTASTPSSAPSAAVATPDLTGSWSGHAGAQGREAPVALRLVQSGAALEGDLQVSGRGDLSGPVKGSVDGNTVRLQLGSGFARSSSLQVSPDGNQITGNMAGSQAVLMRAK
jgi:DNA-binding NarL/FixJ family response regulator